MSEPQVRLHDVSIAGDVGDLDALLAAVGRAVAGAVAQGTTSTDAMRSTVASSVAESTPR